LLDRELENAKVDLQESCPDFNLFDAFSTIDPSGKGHIDSYDLLRAFKDQDGLDIPSVTEEDAELFVARYDKDLDRKLRFSEFIAAFAPVDQYLAERLLSRRGSGQGFQEKTLLMYRNLWLTHIKIEQ